MPTAARRQARIVALQTFYEIEPTRHPAGDVLRRNLDEPVSENVNPTQPLGQSARDYARELEEGVLRNYEEIDELIKGYDSSLPLGQMTSIDESIVQHV